MDGQKYSAVKPLAWYELVWAGLPILLVFLGGGLGALFGLLAAYTNSRIFRSNLSSVMKFVLTGLVSTAATVLYFILAVVLYIMINQ